MHVQSKGRFTIRCLIMLCLASTLVKAGSQYDAKQRCVVFAATLVETQHDARIDSDPVLAFLCVAFLRLVVKKSPAFLVINLCGSRINATQGLGSLCEPALRTQCDARID